MKKIGNMLNDAIGREEILRAARAQRALHQWDEVVGKLLAGKSSPDRFDHGTLWVSVTGSAWAQELRMMKGLILERLAKLTGDPTLIRDVRFGTRPIEPAEPDPKVARKAISEYRHTIEDKSISEIREERMKSWKGEDPS